MSSFQIIILLLEKESHEPGGVVSGISRLLDDKGHALALVLVVEGEETDVGSWVRLLALFDLVEDMGGVCASEHGQLPESPVPAIVVARHLAIGPMHFPSLQIKSKSL